jgi:predicted RNase H-like nuclease
VLVVGIDWAASDEAKCGLALAEAFEDSISVLELLTGRETDTRRSVDQIAAWLRAEPDTLVAVDAPLGWPSNLARAVASHVAGEPIGKMADSGAFFTRETDRFIQHNFKKTPLEVGADRIARTAFSALCMIQELREMLGKNLRLAWACDAPGVIEVYPAATLKALAGGRRVPPYKKPEQVEARRDILALLEPQVRLSSTSVERAANSDHLLDAVVCTLAALDFRTGRALEPPVAIREQAQREGWIWVRRMDLPG